ncbi:hypothetical protein PRIPAC_88196 [Pristionchus pacificus]|uniref:Inhibitor of growth protein n=1 Tax=Pristionchus pacificus TaxID=54126 RepID=A0A2A6B9U8_PRIPA|nr:hypothetical protein PRIPAC_88196 [Pristionchus pacificus]|eukprot:PDM62631.1 PHD finger motif containing protein [Pristionchus pacificus]
MIYLEDIIELIEDVPDELQRRGGLIQDWERQASEYKREADKLTARLHNDNTLRDEDKAHIYRKIGEMLDRARDVSEKKYDMAHKCHQLLQALSDRVSDWSYHCKLELEVDAPGTTQGIESNFLNETMMVAAAAVNSRTAGSAAPPSSAPPQPPAFRVPDEKPASRRDRVGSSSMSRESTPMFGVGTGAGERRAEAGGGRAAVYANNSRTRDSSLSSSRSGSVTPYDPQAAAIATSTTTQQQQRKRKRDRERERAARKSECSEVPVLKDPMSSYMRKKKEREREERKLREAHRLASQRQAAAAAAAAQLPPHAADAAAAAARAAASRIALKRGNVHANRERTSQQRVIKPEPLDDGYESQLQQQQPARRAGPGRPPGSRTMKCGMSDADDDDLLKFLQGEMPGGIPPQDIHVAMGLEDENIFDFSTLGKDLGNEIGKIQSDRDPSPPPGNYYGTLNATTKASAPGPSRYNNSSDPRFAPTKADLKRQQVRLTARAEIHAIDLDQKERKRRQKEEEMERGEYGRRESRELSLGDGEYGGGAGEGNEEDSDTNLYCYCNMPSEGEMVGCDGKRCPYGGWFHLACLDMLTAPASDTWYCPVCQSRRKGR